MSNLHFVFDARYIFYGNIIDIFGINKKNLNFLVQFPTTYCIQLL